MQVGQRTVPRWPAPAQAGSGGSERLTHLEALARVGGVHPDDVVIRELKRDDPWVKVQERGYIGQLRANQRPPERA